MRRLATLALAATVVAAGAEITHAHGDPASEVLVSDNVFLSFESPYGSSEGRALETLTDEAKRQGFPVKVAVITQRSDLGPDNDLYGRAEPYALHLATDLTSSYVGTLVVAMNGRPGGFAVQGPGATLAARRALTRMKLPRTPLTAAELARLAAVAAQRVAAASGHHLSIPKETTKKKSSPHLLEIFLVAALGLAALGLGVSLLARWLRGGGEAAES
ncbi:MAG TPA: hypothetical protein VE596_12850 [Gaiellaceae bacterium]|nr:hypothetical protein [Gaiellaceae bacterium]